MKENQTDSDRLLGIFIINYEIVIFMRMDLSGLFQLIWMDHAENECFKMQDECSFILCVISTSGPMGLALYINMTHYVTSEMFLRIEKS